jgi:hypothetical protein
LTGRRAHAAFLVAALTVAVRLGPLLALGNHGPDFETYRQMAAAALRGDDVYAQHPLFPYMPYSQWAPALCVGLGELLGVRFQVLVKLLILLGDVLLAVTLLLGLWERAGPRGAVLWTLAFVLNPVSILVSAFHGNLMALVAVLVGLAIVAGDAARDAAPADARLRVATAALLLGIAIAFRSFPLLLVPAFAFWLASTLRGRLAFFVLALVPSAFSALPYLLFAPTDFLQEVFSYSGASDIGWLAALRGVSLLARELKLFAFGSFLLGPTKLLFLLAWGLSLLVLPFASPEGRRRATLLPPLLFVGLYGGVAAQYLVWAIPAAVLARERRLLGYTALATVAMTAHYLVYHPAILLPAPPPAPTEGPLVHLALVVANGGLAAFSCAWALKIARDEGAGASPGVRKALVAGTVAVALFFALLLGLGLVETARALALPVTLGPG